MKKLLIIMLVSVFAVATHAQTAMTNPNGLALDTVSNSTAEGPLLQVNNYKSTVSIVLLVTKISGTVAGSVKWQGSNDGVSYATISSDTLTDATNTYQFSDVPKKFMYYKALITGTGTLSASYKANLYTTRE